MNFPPKKCPKCKTSLTVDKVYCVIESELVRIKVDKLFGSCPRCSHPFRWDDLTARKKIVKTPQIV